jgi:hypothetical protein
LFSLFSTCTDIGLFFCSYSPQLDTIQVFFLSYQQQTEPEALLTVLTTVFASAKDQIQGGSSPKGLLPAVTSVAAVQRLEESAVTFILRWIEFGSADFDRSRKLLQKVLTWVVNTVPSKTNQIKLQCLRYLKPKASSAKATIAPCRLPLFAFPPRDVAEHLTKIEWELFTALEPKEFFGQAWQKSTKNTAAPNLTTINERFNQVSQWVASEIVTAASPKRQKETIEKFIKIADKLFKLRNFNSLVAITSGLNSASIQRLKSLWDSLSSHTRATFEKGRFFSIFPLFYLLLLLFLLLISDFILTSESGPNHVTCQELQGISNLVGCCDFFSFHIFFRVTHSTLCGSLSSRYDLNSRRQSRRRPRST